MNTTTLTRFSKQGLIADLDDRIRALMERYDFDLEDGWSQVEGKPIEVVVAYGRLDAYLDLLEKYMD